MASLPDQEYVTRHAGRVKRLAPPVAGAPAEGLSDGFC